MALRMDELSYSQLVKKAKELDGRSNSSSVPNDNNISLGKKLGTQRNTNKGVTIKKGSGILPSVVKRTKISEPSENIDSKELINAVVSAIRSELRGINSSSSEDANTIYIAKDTEEVETHINVDVTSEVSNIESTLEKLKKLKGEKNGKSTAHYPKG